jgi:hypothetical protein
VKCAKQQGFTGFDDLKGVDPAVESLLGQGQRYQIESHLPKKERSHRKNEWERAQKRLANRNNLDLRVDLKNRLELLAKKEGVPISQLVAFLLYGPVHELETHMINLDKVLDQVLNTPRIKQLLEMDLNWVWKISNGALWIAK